MNNGIVRTGVCMMLEGVKSHIHLSHESEMSGLLAQSSYSKEIDDERSIA